MTAPFFGTPEKPGRFVRIDGEDFAGKSTQTRMARAYSDANGLDIVSSREPGGTVAGLAIRDILLHDERAKLSSMAEALLFTADRHITWESVVRPALEAGRLVLNDRGYETSVAYQAGGGGLPKDFIEQLTKLVMPERYVVPDATILLLISKKERRKRRQAQIESGISMLDKIESRDDDYFDRINAAYVAMGALKHVTLVNAEASPEEVFEITRPIIFGPEYA